MKIPDTYKLNFHPVELEVVEVIDFQNFPVLTVEQNSSGFKYLSYLVQFTPEGHEQRLLTPLTDARLDALKAGSISVRSVFETSELGQVFCVLYDEASGETKGSWLLPLDYFNKNNPVPENYQIPTIALY
jgi:uncharacterized protein DUF6575